VHPDLLVCTGLVVLLGTLNLYQTSESEIEAKGIHKEKLRQEGRTPSEFFSSNFPLFVILLIVGSITILWLIVNFLYSIGFRVN
jgi:hypothetical protein